MYENVDPEDVCGRLGYRLKRATSALRAAMDAGLRTHGLSVPQYACLEQLDQRPGLSNAELARAVFVTRQSMNVVLRGASTAGSWAVRPAPIMGVPSPRNSPRRDGDVSRAPGSPCTPSTTGSPAPSHRNG